MKRVFVFVAVLALASVAFASGTVEESATISELIAKAPDAQALEAFVDSSGLEIGPLITYPNPSEEVLELFGCYYIVTIPDELQEVQNSLVDIMEELDGIEYVESNLRIQLEPEVEEDSESYFFMPDSFPDPYTPNDPLYPQQWSKIHTETDWAWNVSTGEGASIAILDTGVDTDHEDLIDNLDMEHAYNFCHNNTNVEDVIGHGTGVAGCAAATIDNGKGIAGIAGNAAIMPLRLSDDKGNIYMSASVNAIFYAADNGATAINMSFGQNTSNPTELSAVNYAWGKGCFLCSTAGNDDKNEPHYPGAYENVMCVGASDPSDSRCWFSNYGPTVNVYAPGVNVWRPTKEGGYKPVSGTSIACPQIAGLAALIWAAHPDWTNQEVWDKIIESADTITIDKGKVLRMNARKALDVEKIEEIAEQPVTLPFISAIQIQHGSVNFAYSTPDATDYTLSIYDVSGREVYARDGQLAGSGEITYNPVSLSEGVYFWRISTEQGEVSGKFVYVK